MPEHVCNKEQEITEIHAMLTRIDQALRGNGRPGLFTQFAVWKNTVMGLLALNVIIISALIGLWVKK